jgi:predicted metal-dependent hydrolase
MDARLREGIRLFNERQFFACHEILEEFYQNAAAENRPFLEGLIQLAAAFRLFADFGETKGSVRMIYQALIRFENFQPAYLQVRVKDLCQAAEAWAKAAEAAKLQPSMETIPKIQFQRFGFFS